MEALWNSLRAEYFDVIDFASHVRLDTRFTSIVLVQFRRRLEPSWGRPGTVLGRLGPFWGCLRAVWGGLGITLGRSWGCPGTSSRRLEGMLP